VNFEDPCNHEGVILKQTEESIKQNPIEPIKENIDFLEAIFESDQNIWRDLFEDYVPKVNHNLDLKVQDDTTSVTPSRWAPRRNNIKKNYSESLDKYNPKDRLDIIHRSLLRTIKRFFHNIFRSWNKRLFNRRFTTVPWETSLKSLREFWEDFIPTKYDSHNQISGDFYSSMSEFLFYFFSLKSSDKFVTTKNGADGADNGEKVFKILYSYKSIDYNNIHKNPHFKCLFKTFSNFIESYGGRDIVILKEIGKIKKGMAFKKVNGKFVKKLLRSTRKSDNQAILVRREYEKLHRKIFSEVIN